MIIKVDEELHGKVYLFYMGIEPEGFIVTSGNFTDKGLIRSHEFGVMIEDAEQQKNMADMLMAISTYDLDEKSLNRLYNEAVTFIDKHTRIKVEEFKAKKIIDKKPSESQKTNQHFYIKPIGTSKNPFIEPMVLNDNDTTGFNKNPKSMNKGDILICHSVGTSNIIGYYEVSDDEAVYIKNDDEDRWPWKVNVECHSGKYSQEWWKYNMKTQELVSEFLHENPDKHITAVGTNTIGSLQWGNDKLQITKEFALFIINKLEKV